MPAKNNWRVLWGYGLAIGAMNFVFYMSLRTIPLGIAAGPALGFPVVDTVAALARAAIAWALADGVDAR